jgi:DNA-binding transcriptional MerR regulator
MNEDRNYTLAELAETTGLTERTVRYYIEQVLPPHHKQGRGTLARYGTATLNAIRFILLVGERYGFRPGQAKGVLAGIGQDTVDRVVRGEEELAVMTVPLDASVTKLSHAASLSRASERMEKYRVMEPLSPEADRSARFAKNLRDEEPMSGLERRPLFESPGRHPSAPGNDPWQTIYTSGPVRIQFRGRYLPNAHQREQLEAAARLIELALK